MFMMIYWDKFTGRLAIVPMDVSSFILSLHLRPVLCILVDPPPAPYRFGQQVGAADTYPLIGMGPA